MAFNAYLALGSMDAESDAFTETSAAEYARQAVAVDARNVHGFVAYGGKLTGGTTVNAAHPTGRSAIIFPASHEATAHALYADATGGEPFAWWACELNAAAPYTREGGLIEAEPQGPGFELVLDNVRGAPVARVAKAA